MKILFIMPAEIVSTLEKRDGESIENVIGSTIETALGKSGFNIKYFYNSLATSQSINRDVIRDILLYPTTTLGKLFSQMLERNLLSLELITVTVEKIILPARPDIYDFIICVSDENNVAKDPDEA